jgi:hypothetical protein
MKSLSGTVRSPRFSRALLLPKSWVLECKCTKVSGTQSDLCNSPRRYLHFKASLGNVAVIQGCSIFTPELYVLGIRTDLPKEIVDGAFV